MGYKYMLEVDISKCYENIYTHSITWALLGKELAKSEFKKDKNTRNQNYHEADSLDQKVRSINNNETKGIPTGPITSRVISELIFSEIDSILAKENIKYKRYVDDFKFYFKTKQEAEIFIPKFQRILYEFKLHINNEKTAIKKYPYEIQHNLHLELSNFDIKKHGVVNFINRFNELYFQGNKGALKYGLKVLRRKPIKKIEHKMVLSHLINILLISPQIADLIIEIFDKNTFKLDGNVSNVLNDIIESSLNLNHEVEVIWLLYFSMKFNLEITIKNTVNILKYFETFSTILILDYIFKNGKYTDKNIKKELDNLKKRLKQESIYGDKWLLIYECNLNKWIKGIKVNLNKSSFLKELFEKGLKFYFSPYKNIYENIVF